MKSKGFCGKFKISIIIMGIFLLMVGLITYDGINGTVQSMTSKLEVWQDPTTGYKWLYRVTDDGIELVKDVRYDDCSLAPVLSGDVAIPPYIDNQKVKRIGAEVFAGCVRLETIKIPAGVVEIGGVDTWTSFAGCRMLTNIVVEADNATYKSVDGVLYDKALETLILCPPGKVNVSIPSGVKVIGTFAFGQCRNIKSLVIPQSVTRIGGFAFFGCFSLRSVCFCGDAPVCECSDGGIYDFTSDELKTYARKDTRGWNKGAENHLQIPEQWNGRRIIFE